MWSAALVAGGWLAGCAQSEAEHKSSVVKQNNAQPVTPANQSAFTTAGKPTKTIKTPNGPVEIYDPTKDVEVIQIFKKWYEDDRYSILDYSEYLGRSKEWDVLLRAEALQSLDLKRAGCEAVIQGNGRLESYNQVEKGGLKPRVKLLYFTKNCGNQHNFGAYELTKCEANNKSTIPKSKARRRAFAIRVAGERTLEAPMVWKASESGVKISDLQKERGNFNIVDNGLKNEVIGVSSGKSYLSQLSGIVSQKCEKWRGIKPHEQISYPINGRFTVFFFDFYPEEPLAPPEFQTPRFRNFITSQSRHVLIP